MARRQIRQTSKPGRQTVKTHASVTIMHLILLWPFTSDLWPWKSVKRFPLKWWLLVACFSLLKCVHH